MKNPIVNLDELRQATLQAIEDGRRKAAEDKSAKEAASKARSEREEAEAAEILAAVPSICHKSASEGRWGSAVVYTTPKSGFPYPGEVQRLDLSYNTLHDGYVAMTAETTWRNDLPVGVCRKIDLVFKSLKEMGLQPVLRWGCSGTEGEYEWYSIVINW